MNNYTSQTLKVLSLAQSESRRLGHNFLGSEQLLVGILGESSCWAAKLLNSVSLTLDAVKEKVEARIGRGPGYVAIQEF